MTYGDEFEEDSSVAPIHAKEEHNSLELSDEKKSDEKKDEL